MEKIVKTMLDTKNLCLAILIVLLIVAISSFRSLAVHHVAAMRYISELESYVESEGTSVQDIVSNDTYSAYYCGD